MYTHGHAYITNGPKSAIEHTNGHTLIPRGQVNGTRDRLGNSEIIAIVGIFASIITTVFGGWLLNKLRKQLTRKTGTRTKSTENLGASSISPHEPSPVTILVQGLEISSSQPLTVPPIARLRLTEAANLVLLIPIPTLLNHQLLSPEQPGTPPDIRIRQPSRAHTWDTPR